MVADDVPGMGGRRGVPYRTDPMHALRVHKSAFPSVVVGTFTRRWDGGLVRLVVVEEVVVVVVVVVDDVVVVVVWEDDAPPTSTGPPPPLLLDAFFASFFNSDLDGPVAAVVAVVSSFVMTMKNNLRFARSKTWRARVVDGFGKVSKILGLTR